MESVKIAYWDGELCHRGWLATVRIGEDVWVQFLVTWHHPKRHTDAKLEGDARYDGMLVETGGRTPTPAELAIAERIAEGPASQLAYEHESREYYLYGT